MITSSLVAGIVAAFALLAVLHWYWAWFSYTPNDHTCVQVPAADRALAWRGYDGAWLYNNHVVGYSLTDDPDSCLSNNPMKGTNP